jgi:hypothetical protein
MPLTTPAKRPFSRFERMHPIVTLHINQGRITGLHRHEGAAFTTHDGTKYRAVNMLVKPKIPFGQHRPGKLTKNPIPGRVIKAARFERV